MPLSEKYKLYINIKLCVQEKKELTRLRRWADKHNIPWDKVEQVINTHREDAFSFLDGERIVMANRSAPRQGSKTLGMSAYYDDYITVAEQWIKELVMAGPDTKQDVEDAFQQMVGHERSHHILDYRYPIISFPSQMKFCQYANEIHADILGCKLAFKDDHARAIRAMAWLAERVSPKSMKDSLTHPSRSHRLEFVRRGMFNEKIIQEIAEMAGCRDKALIASVVEYYKDGEVRLNIQQEPEMPTHYALVENTVTANLNREGGILHGKDCKDQQPRSRIEDNYRIDQDHQPCKQRIQGGRRSR